MATAQDVIDRARQLINDVASSFVSGLRWSDTELLQWVTDGQREIVVLEPEANAITDVFAVVNGMPRQQLDPTIAYRLIRVEANGSSEVASDDLVIQAALVSADPFIGYSSPLAIGLGTILSEGWSEPYVVFEVGTNSGAFGGAVFGIGFDVSLPVFTALHIVELDETYAVVDALGPGFGDFGYRWTMQTEWVVDDTYTIELIP